MADKETGPESPDLWRTFTERAARFIYEHERPEGWTFHEIDQAGLDLGLCPWHRLSDARKEGWITWAWADGKRIRRPGPSSATQGASVTTAKGANRFRNG